jgi:putative oxidoreductase
MSLFKSPSARQVSIALAALRVILGATFIAHGAQKLFVFGFAGVAGGFAQMGIPMPGFFGPFVGLVEFFGGIAIVLGLLTRVAALGLAVNMVVAMLAVHLKAGFFNPGGVEFPLALFGMAVALLTTGAGAFSVDALLNRSSVNDGVPAAADRESAPNRKAA